MQTTMNLLEAALKVHPAAVWHEKLELSKNALHAAKNRGHLSPAIAGALAEELGEPVERWVAIAAIESERDSACKSRMMRRFLGAAAIASAALAPVGAASAATVFNSYADGLYIMLSRMLKRIARMHRFTLMPIKATAVTLS